MALKSEYVAKLKALKLTDGQRNLLAAKICPECEVSIDGPFRAVPEGSHSFAPEIYATLREHGIDTSCGHKVNCSLYWLRL